MNTRQYSIFLTSLGICLILLSMVGTSAIASPSDTTHISVAYDRTKNLDRAFVGADTIKPQGILSTNTDNTGISHGQITYDSYHSLMVDPLLVWNTFLGGTWAASGNDLILDQNGNIFVTGYCNSTWGNPVRPFTGGNGATNAFVAKLDPNGNLIWNTFFDEYEGNGIAIDDNGNVYVIGNSMRSWGNPIRAHTADMDAFVAKLNPSGSLIWNTFLGGYVYGSNATYDDGFGIALDISGNVYVTGYSMSSWGSPTRDFSGNYDAFAAKLDSSGSLTWNTFLGGANGDWGYGIATDNGGNVIIVGCSFSTWGNPFQTSGDTFASKLDSSGNLIWNTFIGGGVDNFGYTTVTLDESSNVYVTGRSGNSWGNPLRAYTSGLDAFVAKLNPSGNLIWNTFLGGNAYYDEGFDIALDGSGNIYVTGYSGSSWGSPVRSYTGNYDAFATELDSSGNLIWNTFLGGSDNNEYGRGIAVDGNGNVYVGGTSYSTPWGIPLNLIGDVFIAKLASVNSPILDLSVDSISPVQVLEGQPFVKNKATAVKVVIRKTGGEAANNVSVRLDDGPSTITNFYVAEPSNMDTDNVLVADNTIHPLNFSSGETTKTIFFFSDKLAPTGSSFQVSVTVDYLGTFAETDETNNTRISDSILVSDTTWSGPLFPDLYIHYFRTDWNKTPITTFDNYYNANNDFLKGVYPVAEQRFQSNKSNTYNGNTTAFRLGDGKLDLLNLGLWIMTTLPQMRIAHPTADRFIATVPQGWFAANTTDALNKAIGVAYPAMRELVVTEARTTNRPNGPSVAAHEIGHSYKLDLSCEEYNDCNLTRQDGIGNYASAGMWVDKRIPIQVSADRNIYCFMGAYDNREYWIDSNDYSTLLNETKVTALNSESPLNSSTQAILAVGIIHNDGTVTLDNWYVLPEAELSNLVPGPYTFEYQDSSGSILYQQSFGVSFDLMGTTLTESPFVFTIPYIAGTYKIIIKDNNVTETEKSISPNAPITTVISPNGGERVDGQTTIQWSGSDLDGNAISYMVLFSADNGTTWNPIVSNLTMTSYQWDVSGLPAGTQYLIKVVATDGINTGQDTSDTPFTVISNLYLPLIMR